MKDRMVAVVGRTGFGKSSKLRELVASRDRVIILEQNVNKQKEWDSLGVVWFNTFAEMYEMFRTVKPRRFRVGVVPGRTFFVDCLRLAWALGSVTVVGEEMGKYFPYRKKLRPYHMDIESGGNMSVPGEFLEICERGRHAGPNPPNTPVAFIAASQRPKRLPLCFQAELDRTYAFRLNLGHDRRWLAECPGSEEQLAEQTKNLPKFNYLNIDADGGHSLETTKP